MSTAAEFRRRIFFKHIGKQVSNDGTNVKNLIKRSFHSRLLFSVSLLPLFGAGFLDSFDFDSRFSLQISVLKILASE